VVDIYAECSDTQSKEYSESTTEEERTGERSEKETVETTTSPKGPETLKPLELY
jgi:hypothetical protein